MSRRLFCLLLAVAVAPTVVEGGAPPAPAKKVLLIGIDGCRPDALQKADAPNLHGLVKEGAYSFAAKTGDVTLSGPGWASMLTGVWRDKHGVRGNDFEGKNFTDFPSFLDRAKKARPGLRAASFATWGPINTHIVAAPDVKVFPKNDAAAETACIKEIKENDPDIVFVHFDDVDHAGHGIGFGPAVPEYLKAIADTDVRVGNLLKAVRARPTYAKEDWLVLVSTDHGGSGKNHGRDTPEHRTIFVVAHGPSVTPGEIDPPPAIVDVAATALTHLGVAIDPAAKLDGRSIGTKTKKAP